METQKEATSPKITPCMCTTVLGILVIVFAWWSVGWAPIALTIIGAILAIRGLVNQCCCSGGACATAQTKPDEPAT